jgi:hypothetical protein
MDANSSLYDSKELSVWKSCRERKEIIRNDMSKCRVSAKPLINEYAFDLEDDNFYAWQKSLIKNMRREYNYPKIDENSKEIANKLNRGAVPAYIRLYSQSFNKCTNYISFHS